jgi:hypothetical protein
MPRFMRDSPWRPGGHRAICMAVSSRQWLAESPFPVQQGQELSAVPCARRRQQLPMLAELPLSDMVYVDLDAGEVSWTAEAVPVSRCGGLSSGDRRVCRRTAWPSRACRASAWHRREDPIPLAPVKGCRASRANSRRSLSAVCSRLLRCRTSMCCPRRPPWFRQRSVWVRMRPGLLRRSTRPSPRGLTYCRSTQGSSWYATWILCVVHWGTRYRKRLIAFRPSFRPRQLDLGPANGHQGFLNHEVLRTGRSSGHCPGVTWVHALTRD